MLDKIFGNNSVILILNTFLKKENREKWLNVREIGRRSGISSGTVSRRINELVENGVLIEENPSEYRRIFKLNIQNPYVPILINFFDQLCEIE